MNVLLKSMLETALDVVDLGKAVADKKWTKLFSILIDAGEGLPTIVKNWSDLKPELDKLLSDPSADADLLSYAVGLVGGENEKAKAIIAASADLVLTGSVKVAALVKAIQMESVSVANVAEPVSSETPVVEEAKVENLDAVEAPVVSEELPTVEAATAEETPVVTEEVTA